MLSSYSDIFNILKYSLFPNDIDVMPLSSNADWNYIFKEMQSQTISTLAAPWLKTHSIPDSDLHQRWMTSCLQQQTRWMQVMHAQSQLINLMEQHKIPCVVIKGAAAMIAYPQPSLRAVGDIDILVKREDYNRAVDTLSQSGYHVEPEKDSTDYHICYIKGDVSFELHRRLGTIDETEEQLMTIFEKGIDNREWHTIGNASFPCLPTDLNGLVLLIHIKQHLRNGLGLRQIIDWMMYAYSNDNLNVILPLIRVVGLERLAKTVTIMCQEYCGLPVIINGTADYPYDELMEYIISNGNFGIKVRENEESRIAYVSQITRNPIHFIKRLQEGGLCRWEAAKSHNILRPFAWLYQIGFIITELIKNKVTPSKIFKSHKVGMKHRDLIERLL